jgi:nicotinamide riboside kinase
MKIAVSGTYSSGKTLTVMALAHHTGIPRTLAATIREILPSAVPGKTLAEVTPAEYLQLAMRRHVGRAVNEALLGDPFITDGSSLQEWAYAAARVRYGMNPALTADADIPEIPPEELSEEMRFFAAVTDQFGHAVRQHVKDSFDVFVHLRNELPLSADGHRPMNDRFRDSCDRMLLAALDDLRIPYYVVGGDLPARLTMIVDVLGLPTPVPVGVAIERAQAEYAALDRRLETQRTAAAGVAVAAGEP